MRLPPLRLALPLLLSLPLSFALPASAASPDAILHPGGPACAGAARSLSVLESFQQLLKGRGALGRFIASYAELLGRRIADQCVALNQVQVLGTHNSYHIEPRASLLQTLLLFSPDFHDLEYTHLPLDQQFEHQGVRQIEIDVFADPKGGLYQLRRSLALVGEPILAPDPVMGQPGFKVLHIQDIDFDVTCLTFVRCLQTVKTWSDTHPRHLPITILVELKDDAIIDPLKLGFTVPLRIDSAALDALDAEIRSVFPPSRLVTPDDVRGSRATLEEAVLNDGWPSLGDARGKVMFLMDNGDAHRQAYLDGHPSLAGRILFTNAVPGDPDAAFVEENDPLADPTLIPDLVKQGYVVRTRADADTHEARTGDVTNRDAAIASGAQWVSTDYPVPDPRFGTGYFVKIPGGTPGRCNPVNAPPGCRTGNLEP